MTEQIFNVAGMTCDHCVSAVTSELGKLPGVSDVKVDLVRGTATVTSVTPLDRSDVAIAIDEAGYALAP
jgi:copper chaperone CopZ